MSMNVSNILTKTVGVIGLSLVAYDAHVAGKIESHAAPKNHKSEVLAEHYMDELKLDSPSVVKQHVKKGLFKYFLDENISEFFTGVGGYISGFSSMLVSNVIPFGLAVGTLMGKKDGHFLRSQGFSKFCGAGLLAYGGIFLAQELFGIGKSK